MSKIIKGFCWHCLERLLHGRSWVELEQAFSDEDARVAALFPRVPQ